MRRPLFLALLLGGLSLSAPALAQHHDGGHWSDGRGGWHDHGGWHGDIGHFDHRYWDNSH